MKTKVLSLASLATTIALCLAAWVCLVDGAEAQGDDPVGDCVCRLKLSQVVTPGVEPECFHDLELLFNPVTNGSCGAPGCSVSNCKYQFGVNLFGDAPCCFHLRCGTPPNNFNTWTETCTLQMGEFFHNQLDCTGKRIYRVFAEDPSHGCSNQSCSSGPGEPMCYNCGGNASQNMVNNQIWYVRVTCEDCIYEQQL